MLQGIKIVVIAVVACCLAKQVSARGGPSMTVDDLQMQLADNVPGFVGFVMGVAQLSDTDHPMNFCVPPGMIKNIPDTVARFMKGMYLAYGITDGKANKFGRSNAAVMVVIALNGAFPCKPP